MSVDHGRRRNMVHVGEAVSLGSIVRRSLELKG
jgi:hypothetical protein